MRSKQTAIKARVPFKTGTLLATGRGSGEDAPHSPNDPKGRWDGRSMLPVTCLGVRELGNVGHWLTTLFVSDAVLSCPLPYRCQFDKCL